MEARIFCSVCSQPGRINCFCNGLPTAFCSTCYSQHTSQHSSLLHMSNSIEMSPAPKRAPEYSMCFCGNTSQRSCKFCKLSCEYKKRRLFDSHDYNNDEISFFADKIQEELRKNKQKLLEFKETLNKTQTKIIEYLNTCMLDFTQKIQSIERLITEIEEGLFTAKQNLQLDEKIYAHWLIKDYIDSPRLSASFSMNLFDYTIDMNILMLTMAQFCKFTFSPIPSPSLSFFKPKSNTCLTYSLNSQTLTKSSINTTEQFRNGAAWCQISNQKYFYSGGESKGISNQASLIFINDGSVFSMPSMNSPRAFHALLYHNKNIYAFGGNTLNGKAKSAEKYDFERSQWIALPNMLQARSNFTAAAWKNKIYVAGGSGSGIIEVFDTVEVCFSKIPIILPHQSYWTLTGCYGQNILIFQGNYLLTINLQEENSYTKKSIEINGSWWSEMPIYTFKESFYFIKKNAFIEFDCKTNVLTEIAEFN